MLSWSWMSGGNVFWNITGVDSTISSGPGGNITWYFSAYQKAPGIYTIAGLSSSSFPGNCPGYDTLWVTVVGAPEVILGNYGPLCSNDAPIILVGSPEGGAWSGTGVNGNQFDPEAGTQTLTYTVTQDGCTGSAQTSIVVDPAPNAGSNGALALCSDQAPADLFASLQGTPQAGGTWSGPSPTTGIYAPGTMEPGIYTYTVSGSGACADATATVLVSELPAPNAGVSSSVNLCSNSAPIDMRLALSGSPDPNGTWNGPSPTSGLFDPATMLSGLYTYTVIGSVPCMGASATLNIAVVQAANAGNGGNVAICSNGLAFDLFSQLNGTPQLGGTWSGPDGLSNGIFIPGQSPTSIYQYSVSGTGPCPNATATVLITEQPAPNAGASSSVNVCSNSAPINMRLALAGSPDPNGTWSDPDPLGGFFDPSSMPPGVYTYTVIGSGVCLDATATLTVSVTPAANAGSNGTVEVCDGLALDLFSQLGGTPQLGGNWSGPDGPSSGIFIPGQSPTGIYVYFVTGVGPCPSASAQLQVSVVELDLLLDFINGPTDIGEVEPLTYTALPFLADADSFSWSIPEGWNWFIPDSTSATVVLLPPEQETNATICVTAHGGNCSGNTVCLTQITVGVRNIPNSSAWLTVYPNPSDGIFQLTPQGSHGERTEIVVYDALGHIVSGPFVIPDQQPYTLRLEDQSSGMYFMRVVRGGEVKVMELLIQR